MLHFPAEQIIIENVPYRGNFGKVLRTVVEPETICEVLEKTGVGLLLDISHARIAANFLGMPAFDYLGQLPTRQIKEMHFTGLHPYQGRLQDHLEALPEDWPVLDWVLEKIHSGNVVKTLAPGLRGWRSWGEIYLANRWTGLGPRYPKTLSKSILDLRRWALID